MNRFRMSRFVVFLCILVCNDNYAISTTSTTSGTSSENVESDLSLQLVQLVIKLLLIYNINIIFKTSN